MASNRGRSLVRYIDGAQVTGIREQLRRPKRDAPGLTHALHNLFDAYVQLEAEVQRLAEGVQRARKELDGL